MNENMIILVTVCNWFELFCCRSRLNDNVIVVPTLKVKLTYLNEFGSLPPDFKKKLNNNFIFFSDASK